MPGHILRVGFRLSHPFTTNFRLQLAYRRATTQRRNAKTLRTYFGHQSLDCHRIIRCVESNAVLFYRRRVLSLTLTLGPSHSAARQTTASLSWMLDQCSTLIDCRAAIFGFSLPRGCVRMWEHVWVLPTAK